MSLLSALTFKRVLTRLHHGTDFGRDNFQRAKLQPRRAVNCCLSPTCPGMEERKPKLLRNLLLPILLSVMAVGQLLVMLSVPTNQIQLQSGGSSSSTSRSSSSISIQGLLGMGWNARGGQHEARRPTTTTMHRQQLLPPKEVEKARSYVSAFRDLRRRPLSFFHIPKTAGTAIEEAAAKRRVAWGSCAFYHKPKRLSCPYPKSEEWPEHLAWWHIPVQFFPLQNINPYLNAELFGVIRDPYDRMVSEFYYICTLKVFDWRPDQCERDRLLEGAYMNSWLRKKLSISKKGSSGNYMVDNGHFTPQYEYIVGPHEVRMLDHVLKMDQGELSAQFGRLMQAYSLAGIQLVKLNALGAAVRNESAHLGVKDFEDSTVRMIRDKYPNDFDRFGYARHPDQSDAQN